MKRLIFLFAFLYASLSLPVQAMDRNPLEIANDGIRAKVKNVNAIAWDEDGAIRVSFSPSDWLRFSRVEIVNGQYKSALDFHTLREQGTYNGEVWLSLNNKSRQQIVETAVQAWKLRYSNYQLLMQDKQKAKNLLLTRVNQFYSVKERMGKPLANTLIDEGLGAGIIQLKSGS